MYFVNCIVVVVVLLLSSIVFNVLCANSFQLTEFVKRIFEESSDSTSVCFIGISDDYDYDFLTFFMEEHFEIPIIILTNSSDLLKDKNLILDNSIVVLRTLRKDNQIVQILDSFIGRLRVRKFVIISTSTLENLQEWFQYFQDTKFTRIFGIVGNACYAFLPYADNQIQKIVLDKEFILPDAMKDLNGLVIRTSLQRDIPRSFPYPCQQEKRCVGGSYGQVFVNFLKRHNASYQEITISNSTRLTIPNVINATISNTIDFSMNVFTPTPGLDYSYPVKYVSWNILVPINGYVDPNQYFIKPFSFLVWVLIGVSFIYIIFMEVLKDIFLKIPPDIWNSFSRTMLAMLNLSSEKPITSDYCIHIQVLFLYFILGKLYNIYVTSFLTIFIRIKQFDTIQELIDNNVSVMIPYYEWALISDDDLHPEGFEKIVASVDYPTYITEMNSMRNISYAYGVGSDRGEFLIGMQTYFANPLFHPTRDGLVELHLGFLLELHSPFTEILSTFIIDVMATGLIGKWDNDAIVQGIKAGFEVDKTGEHPTKLPIPLTLNHLLFAWNCLVIGWICSVIIFFGEIFKYFFERENN
ncbi:uncharacterized protein LOC129909599 [Episyrphus balteatus]|uniref:uncharacterized protein LOC129909599 n=1 Tax=Episyrphus balteatus TaxID=286459 RepID=UPI002485820E|nr:uncharacterized protein LOC129909599 [Episyrphus balteatus]